MSRYLRRLANSGSLRCWPHSNTAPHDTYPLDNPHTSVLPYPHEARRGLTPPGRPCVSFQPMQRPYCDTYREVVEMSRTNIAPPQDPISVRCRPFNSPKSPQMRPNSASCFSYKHETNETSFSLPKLSPQLRRSLPRRPGSSFFPAPPDTKYSRMRPHFPSYSDRAMRPISDTKNYISATILAALATTCPLCGLSHQIRNAPQCGHTKQADSDTTMRPVRPPLPSVLDPRPHVIICPSNTLKDTPH